MRYRGIVIVVIAATFAGCSLFDRLAERVGTAKSPPTFSQYHLDGWSWDTVDRVVVLQFLNESEYTRAGVEVRAAFTSEFQRLGRFEVVATVANDRPVLAAKIHRQGEFDEAEMLEIASQNRADVVIHGVVTQYSPYPRPRLGIILQAVGPMQAKVVASVDGLWDTTDKRISDRLRTFYRQRPRERPPFIRNYVIASDDAFASELALDSPALFQRFVCHEAALTLLGLPVPGVICPDPQPRIGFAQPPTQPPAQPGAGMGPKVPMGCPPTSSQVMPPSNSSSPDSKGQ
jgi:hypothetical protein